MAFTRSGVRAPHPPPAIGLPSGPWARTEGRLRSAKCRWFMLVAIPDGIAPATRRKGSRSRVRCFRVARWLLGACSERARLSFLESSLGFGRGLVIATAALTARLSFLESSRERKLEDHYRLVPCGSRRHDHGERSLRTNHPREKTSDSRPPNQQDTTKPNRERSMGTRADFRLLHACPSSRRIRSNSAPSSFDRVAPRASMSSRAARASLISASEARRKRTRRSPRS